MHSTGSSFTAMSYSLLSDVANRFLPLSLAEASCKASSVFIWYFFIRLTASVSTVVLYDMTVKYSYYLLNSPSAPLNDFLSRDLSASRRAIAEFNSILVINETSIESAFKNNSSTLSEFCSCAYLFTRVDVEVHSSYLPFTIVSETGSPLIFTFFIFFCHGLSLMIISTSVLIFGRFFPFTTIFPLLYIPCSIIFNPLVYLSKKDFVFAFSE